MAEKEDTYRLLVNRFRDLEASHAQLTEQLKMVVQEKEEQQQQQKSRRSSRRRSASVGGAGNGASDLSCWDPSLGRIPGTYSSGGPYRKVLQSLGHALHVSRFSDGRIIYWNFSAEKLYGWKENEVLGKRVLDLLVEDHNRPLIEAIRKRISTGQSWSGQLPFKKKTGEMFMTLVTKSPLYEDGKLLGVVTVSSNADIFNLLNSQSERKHPECSNVPPGERKFNMKKIQWNLQPQIASIPQISSSVSNLASKVFSRRQEVDGGTGSNDTSSTRSTSEQCPDDEVESANSESKRSFGLRIGRNPTEQSNGMDRKPKLSFVQPSKIAAKVVEKLNIREGRKIQEGSNKVLFNILATRSTGGSLNHPKVSRGTSFESNANETSDFRSDGKGLSMQNALADSATDKIPFVDSWLECNECYQMHRTSNSLLRSGLEWEGKVDAESKAVENLDDTSEAEATVHRKVQVTESPQLLSPADSMGSSHENSWKEDKELSSVIDCEISWEDLHLGEEIGQGSYAVVYRGIWNGSDVAIKVYFESEYREATLLDYKKEVDIMKRLRHPNVLLFMGAVYSPERLAIVTEFLPRGSLFKALHKNNQKLDLKRRLRMALDVARGMNYLHRRNPPIVHRDLKSTNLLVDRNWNVKVGDFGLSKWKNATLLTAKSGIGSPQWMAPEVLRNEPSDEKSDVFSFGVILWELMTELIPWANLNSLQVVGIVGFMGHRLDLPESLDPKLASIIHDCWQSDPGQRPSFQDLIRRMAEVMQKFLPLPPAATAPIIRNS